MPTNCTWSKTYKSVMFTIDVRRKASSSSKSSSVFSSSPISKLREIERCLICHFLDLHSVARLLRTSKFFSDISANVVLWKPVLRRNWVHVYRQAIAPRFCSLSPIICQALIYLEVTTTMRTQELFEHLIHLPHLTYLWFPFKAWLLQAIENKNVKVERTLQHLCTCLRSIGMILTTDALNYIAKDCNGFQQLLNRFGNSSIRSLRLSAAKIRDGDVLDLQQLEGHLTFPSMEELVVDNLLECNIRLGSHYNILRATYNSCRSLSSTFYGRHRAWTLGSIASAMAQPDVHVHTLIVPSAAMRWTSAVPHPLPVLRIAYEGFAPNDLYGVLQAFPYVIRLEVTNTFTLHCVIEKMQPNWFHLDDKRVCLDLQQIHLIGGTVEQQQEYQLKLNEMCKLTKRRPIELVLW